ncbi:capsid triplex subunit 1 [Pteropodid alphaherpesvirus 1]|uniref:Capsid triplex subunit 1 n=1 Tax=Pteropodid alphaherpesvirus 1 TaxID=1343901 RepID=A0A060Q1V8_9ALPH|nr:capsid triplex subunit 1 [Pteropodid alphaherpesvirus 1]BAP00717.1 capsid triplex subunit 1 [Pteropodid alphaherpesvirus 1]
MRAKVLSGGVSSSGAVDATTDFASPTNKILSQIYKPPIARQPPLTLSKQISARGSATTLWLLGVHPKQSPLSPLAQPPSPSSAPHIVQRVLLSAHNTPSRGPPYQLTRQVTLTDLCQPDAEQPGTLLLTLRHPRDYPFLALHNASPGRQVERLGEAWGRLLEMTAGTCGRSESGCTRASVVSLSFLVAACADAYDDRDAAEALKIHVTTNYRGARVASRLEQFGECLRAMVHTQVFPHELLRFWGGLVTAVTQDELASVTAVCRGPQEATHTGNAGKPRSVVTVPACAFIDLDAELGCTRPGTAFVYLVFSYRQRRDQEMCQVHIIKSHFPPRNLEPALERLWGRLRTTNTIHGIEGAVAPPPPQHADFPLPTLAADPRAPRCSASQVEVPQFFHRLFRWQPDLRGRPTSRSCAYAAFATLGIITQDSPRCIRRVEKFGSVSVPIVALEGMVWRPTDWQICA